MYIPLTLRRLLHRHLQLQKQPRHALGLRRRQRLAAEADIGMGMTRSARGRPLRRSPLPPGETSWTATATGEETANRKDRATAAAGGIVGIRKAADVRFGCPVLQVDTARVGVPANLNPGVSVS